MNIRKMLRLAVILPLIMLVFCSRNSSSNNGLTILTSFYPMYIATLNVASGVPNVKVENMTGPQTGCLHDYQLTPRDLRTLSGASIFVVNGGGMESFLNKVISGLPDLRIVDASKGIELVKGEDSAVNPHVWVSVTCAMQQVKNIVEGLAAADTANAAKYRSNAEVYIAKLEALRKKMHDGLAGIKLRNIITFHEAFPYFAKEFDLTIVAVIEREPGSEPSAGELARTVEIIRTNDVKALFAEPQYPAKAAETIARETGLKVYTLDPAVNGPFSPDAYLKIMESNLSALQSALK